jgi:hypothetical protein
MRVLTGAVRLTLPVALAAFAQAAAVDGPMHFSLHRPCQGTASFCGPYILAQGEITSSSPSEFENIVRKLNFQPSVYFNSPGGSLGAGIMLGRVIRKFGLDTYVGGPYKEVKNVRGYTDTLVERGLCLSACAYAFMGGRTRELADGGILGVHQFQTRDGDSGEGSAQLTVAILSAYLEEMGIDRALLDLASATKPAQIEVIPPRLAQALKLDNADPPKSEWQLKAGSNGDLILTTVQR